MTNDSLKGAIKTSHGGILLSCYIQPKASKNAVIGLYDNSLKISLTAPPVDGKANQALTKYLSKLLSVSRSSVSIVSGLKGRRKQVAITTDDVQAVKGALAKLIS